MDFAEALAYLDEHINLEKRWCPAPTSPRSTASQRLMAVMGDPQHAAPVIHITGTNGKGSTAQIATRLLVAQGLSVGTYTSPHLERVNERIARNGEPISDEDFADMIAAVADLEALAGVRPSYFEILTAAALRWFADVAVDAMVVEVGLLGRWDATNVVDGRVAVVTNVGLDHTEYAGPDPGRHRQREGGHREARLDARAGRDRPRPGRHLPWPSSRRTRCERELDFDCLENQLALGRSPARPAHARGRSTPTCSCPCTAPTRATTPPPRSPRWRPSSTPPSTPRSWRRASPRSRCRAASRSLHHQPAGDPRRRPQPGRRRDAAPRCSTTTSSPPVASSSWSGMLQGRDPLAMLEALQVDRFELVVCCTPPSPRAVPATRWPPPRPRRRRRRVVVVPDVAGACDYARWPTPTPTTPCSSPARSTPWARPAPTCSTRLT